MSQAKLTILSLRRLREELFQHQLASIQNMVDSGVDDDKIAALSHCTAAIAAIDTLQGVPHKRQR
jgi:hypothetical protein